MTQPYREPVEECPNCGESGIAYPSLDHYRMDPDRQPDPASSETYRTVCHIGTIADSRLAGRKIVHP